MFTSKRCFFIILTTIILIAILTFSVFKFFKFFNELTTVTPYNFYIENVNIEHKMKNEVTKIFNNLNDEMLNRTIKIIYNNGVNKYEYNYTCDELGISTDKDKVFSEVTYYIGIGNNSKEKIINYIKSKDDRKDFKLSYNIDNDILINRINEFDNIELSSPENAYYIYKDGKVEIIESKLGSEFDKEKLVELIIEKINTDEKNIEIEFPIKNVYPEITTEMLKDQGINELLASFTTEFDYKNKPRTENLKVATYTIDGTILAPGEIFSMNETLGERTQDKGYKVAPIFVNGVISKGLGGGICQVATTLYNSVLFSNLEIVERDHHSLTVSYVPLSRDAAISWGIQDLKFKNNTDNFIYIHGEVNEKTMTFEIFGTKNKDVNVKLETIVHNKIEPDVKEILDNNLPKGKKIVVSNGRAGYKSSLYKIIYKNGEEIERVKMSTDTYGTNPKIIRVGTK